MPFLVALCLLLAVLLLYMWRRARRLARDAFIRNHAFPVGLLDRLAARRPGMTLKDRLLVSRGLRQFFLAYLHSGGDFVSMPSQAADDLWHEFILYTRHYEAFCRQAFGGFLHHTPAVVLGEDKRGNAGLRRCWWYACKEENIDPREPTRLPLLFALDGKLDLADGFRYSTDCSRLAPDRHGCSHCAGDFSSSSVDGSTEGFGEPASDFGSDHGGSDGGCSGGGCGGGGD